MYSFSIPRTHWASKAEAATASPIVSQAPARRTNHRAGRLATLAAAAVFALTLSGCAIEKQRNGRTDIVVDHAELFGRQVETFDIGNGSTGALRRLNGEYSLKFDKSSTMVSVGRATSARILNYGRVGESDVVLVEKNVPGCQAKYQLISMRGREVNTWDFTGNCRVQPVAFKSASGDELFIKFDLGSQWRIVAFKDEQLQQFNMKPPAPQPASKADAVPPPQGRADRSSARPRGEAPSGGARRNSPAEPYLSAAETARKRIQQTPKAPALPTMPDFGRGEDLAPTRIHLK